MAFFISILLIVEVVASFLLIVVILAQKSKDQGLGMAFGGGMGESLFGSRAGNVLTRMTIGLAVVFMLNTILLGVLFARGAGGSGSVMDRADREMPLAPAEPVAPALPPGPAPMMAPGESPVAAPIDPPSGPAVYTVDESGGLTPAGFESSAEASESGLEAVAVEAEVVPAEAEAPAPEAVPAAEGTGDAEQPPQEG